MQYVQANAERVGLKMWHFIMEAVIKVNSSAPGTGIYSLPLIWCRKAEGAAAFVTHLSVSTFLF